MSKPAHAGPTHAPGCLGDVRLLNSPTGHGHCNCERAEWLRELVPRGQARAELLDQLAQWAHEQRIFTQADIDVVAPRGPAAPVTPAGQFVAAGVWAAAQIAERIWVDVRMGAMNLAKECTPHRPDAKPGARYAELDPEQAQTVVTTGGVL